MNYATGENSIIEARILYHSNSYTYMVLLFAVKCKFIVKWDKKTKNFKFAIPLKQAKEFSWSFHRR